MTTPNGLFTQGSTQTKVLRNQWVLGLHCQLSALSMPFIKINFQIKGSAKLRIVQDAVFQRLGFVYK